MGSASGSRLQLSECLIGVGDGLGADVAGGSTVGDDVEVDGLGREAWHQWFTADGAIMLCPLPGTDAFQVQASHELDRDGSPTRLFDLFRGPHFTLLGLGERCAAAFGRPTAFGDAETGIVRSYL